MTDFTLKKYLELCNAIKVKNIFNVRSYFQENPRDDFIILRHDVDRFPLLALDVAKLEKSLSISSTYYFRYSKKLLKSRLINQFVDLGHEVGYHYEVLSKSNGDFSRAIEMFASELSDFRKVADVKTISMHGKPLSKFNNSDLWQRYDFKKFDVIGDAGISIKDIIYFNDTGRSWRNNNNLRDFLRDSKRVEMDISTTDELINYLKNSGESCYISTHPERWPGTTAGYVRSHVIDTTFNCGKWVIRRFR